MQEDGVADIETGQNREYIGLQHGDQNLQPVKRDDESERQKSEKSEREDEAAKDMQDAVSRHHVGEQAHRQADRARDIGDDLDRHQERRHPHGDARRQEECQKFMLVDDDGECRRCAGLSQKLVRVQTKLHVFARRLKLAKRACQMQQSRMAALEARVQALEGQAAVRPRMPPSAFALFKASISAELAGFRGLRAQTQEASRRWRALPGAHKRPFEEVHQAKREAYHAQLRARAARDE